MKTLTITLLLCVCALVWCARGELCLGEYERCKGAVNACTIFQEDCHLCASSPNPSLAYICPLRNACANTAKELLNCPNVTGTHFDWTRSLAARLNYLVANTELIERIEQLTNNVPAIKHLGIPRYDYLNDDEHGLRLPHATSFPNGVTLGASWDRELLRQVGATIGVEARGDMRGFVNEGNRARGNENGLGITVYAPNLNLAISPLWGRAQEVWSEDPMLTGALAVHFVDGLQVGVDGVRGDTAYLQTVANCKHFAAYNLEGPVPTSRTNFSATLNARNAWETFLPAFRRCVVDAQGGSVMASYNSINGVPTVAEPALLNGLLRGQWHFDGFVVSDYDAVKNLVGTHFYCGDYECAIAASMNAGCDQEGGGATALKRLPAAVASGAVSESTVNEAFRRLFRARIMLGMLDPPTLVPFNRYDNTSDVESPQHLQLARVAAQRGIVMLVNRNDTTLPLDARSLKRIVVVGPQAVMTTLLQGNYAKKPTLPITTILDAIRQQVASSSPATEVRWAPGCADVECSLELFFDEAAKAAADADAVIVTLGLDQNLEREGHDRAELALPGKQATLVERLRAATSAPLVGVLIKGGSVALEPIVGHFDALLDAGYPGQMGAPALADLLFGIVSPSGKLATTYYRSQAQLPPMGEQLYNLYESGITYRYLPLNKNDTRALFPFGSGLSYTRFDIGVVAEPPRSVGACDNIVVQMRVRNVGNVAGAEIVQAYVRQNASQSSVPVPPIRLADFARVELAPGGSRAVTLTCAPDVRTAVVDSSSSSSSSIYDPSSVRIESGTLQVIVGTSSADEAFVFTVTVNTDGNKSVPLYSCPAFAQSGK
jgi:beta-glucosidase